MALPHPLEPIDVKNLVLVAAAIVVGATVRGGQLSATPWTVARS
jgi:hypothetical protein